MDICLGYNNAGGSPVVLWRKLSFAQERVLLLKLSAEGQSSPPCWPLVATLPISKKSSVLEATLLPSARGLGVENITRFAM